MSANQNLQVPNDNQLENFFEHEKEYIQTPATSVKDSSSVGSQSQNNLVVEFVGSAQDNGGQPLPEPSDAPSIPYFPPDEQLPAGRVFNSLPSNFRYSTPPEMPDVDPPY
ncbi:hypothetical protein BOX15_Mlig031031g1 [Macrostomum lignano]|uniref:Uncharacterized protein n=1 Tax=Macrostomum lignano TaxID=282301 RepID=A0A267GYC4_9PLAT|nr:hypothetical protein BOX15_Mlig017205g2 [Macrostomum lignano]PAA91033.1 hypothetical protein BOX15_Mlig031031g1 [Macrostomum lignano]